MDWSTFTPTLTATLLGVIISVTLSLGVYRIIHWRRDRREAKETRKALLIELGANEETLQEHIEFFREETEKGHRELIITMFSRLRTGAYEIACQNNRVRLLGDFTLAKDLADLIEDWRFLNLLLQRREDIVIHNLAYALPAEFAELSGSWDNSVKKQAEEFLKETVEVRQRLETAEQRCCPQSHILKRYLSSFFSFTKK